MEFNEVKMEIVGIDDKLSIHFLYIPKDFNIKSLNLNRSQHIAYGLPRQRLHTASS
jgi:hypothetical protein